jgi:hypothetical protein
MRLSRRCGGNPARNYCGLAAFERGRRGSRCGRAFGKRIMAGTLHAGWDAGCDKTMLFTGSQYESTHAFYRACGFLSRDRTGYVARPHRTRDATIATMLWVRRALKVPVDREVSGFWGCAHRLAG